MEKSTLYDLLDVELLRKWREDIEKTESEIWVFTNEREALKELEAELNEKSKRLLALYAVALENRMDYIHYNLKIKILNLGVKIGTELRQAFTSLEP